VQKEKGKQVENSIGYQHLFNDKIRNENLWIYPIYHLEYTVNKMLSLSSPQYQKWVSKFLI
jgi:hypothetical protein